MHTQPQQSDDERGDSAGKKARTKTKNKKNKKNKKKKKLTYKQRLRRMIAPRKSEAQRHAEAVAKIKNAVGGGAFAKMERL